VHIVKGEYPVEWGLILGHEPVGVIDQLDDSLLDEYHVGQRVVVGAITPCGQCYACQGGAPAQCRGPMGGWQLGHRVNGAWAEYMKVPFARGNLAPIPDELTDEQVILVPDVFSTGLAGAESGGILVGDTVAVFAQGPIGLCATAGARLKGASEIIAVDRVAERLAMARRMGATRTIDSRETDPVAEIGLATRGRGVDVAIEALGRQETFEAALRVLRPGGRLSSLGVYSGKLGVPEDAFHAGLGDQKIVTTLCPGGKERMRRLMSMIAARRVDLTPLVTHRFALADIGEAFDLFSHQRHGALKVVLHPHVRKTDHLLEASTTSV